MSRRSAYGNLRFTQAFLLMLFTLALAMCLLSKFLWRFVSSMMRRHFGRYSPDKSVIR